MRKCPRVLYGAFLFFCLFSNQSFAQISPNAFVPCQEMPNLMENYNADLRAIVRFYTSSFFGGRNGGNFVPTEGGSPDKRARLDALYHEYLDKLEQFDFNDLQQECKVDYILFKRDLRQKLEQSAAEAKQYNKVRGYFPFADSIYAIERLRRRGHPLNSELLARDWFGYKKTIGDLQKKLHADSSLDRDALVEAGQVISDLKRALSSIYEFYNGYDPMFTWWIPRTYKELDDALGAYAASFKEKNSQFVSPDKSGIVGQPVGREELLRQLKYEIIPYTPEELIDIANKEFAWCDKEMLRATSEMGMGNDWKKALETVKNKYTDPGQMIYLVRDLSRESIEFVEKHDLVTLPPLLKEDYWEEALTPEQQLVSPFFLGGAVIMVSSPASSQTMKERLESMRGNNIYFARDTVFHELIPGHHMQQYMTQRYRTYRSLFSTPFWTEGMAFYWEMLLWDLGFTHTPEQRIGALVWRMHRCARIIFSLSFHLRKMKALECVQFLVDRVGFEHANAEGEVRRSFNGSYPPIYQCAYMLGALQFYALHKELVGSGKMTNRAFHDQMYQEGNMPVEMVRLALSGQKVTRDYQTSWKFYGSLA